MALLSLDECASPNYSNTVSHNNIDVNRNKNDNNNNQNNNYDNNNGNNGNIKNNNNDHNNNSDIKNNSNINSNINSNLNSNINSNSSSVIMIPTRGTFFDGRKIGKNKIGGKKGENFGSRDALQKLVNYSRKYSSSQILVKNIFDNNLSDSNSIGNENDMENGNIVKKENHEKMKNVDEKNNKNDNDDSDDFIININTDKNSNKNDNNNNNKNTSIINIDDNSILYNLKFLQCSSHLLTCDIALRRLQTFTASQSANMKLVIHEPEILQK